MLSEVFTFHLHLFWQLAKVEEELGSGNEGQEGTKRERRRKRGFDVGPGTGSFIVLEHHLRPVQLSLCSWSSTHNFIGVYIHSKYLTVC